MGDILCQITIAFFAVYGFYSVLYEIKTLMWQWYRYSIGKQKRRGNALPELTKKQKNDTI